MQAFGRLRALLRTTRFAIWSASTMVVTLSGTFYVYPRGMSQGSLVLAEWACESALRRVVALAVFVLFALLMLLIRETQRTAYGALECAFALHIAWAILSARPSSEVAVYGALLGSVYVFVRGLVNARDGWSKLKEEEARKREDQQPG